MIHQSMQKTLLKDDVISRYECFMCSVLHFYSKRLVYLFVVETKLLADAGTVTEIHPAIFESLVTHISGGATAIPGNSH